MTVIARMSAGTTGSDTDIYRQGIASGMATLKQKPLTGNALTATPATLTVNDTEDGVVVCCRLCRRWYRPAVLQGAGFEA